MAIGSTILSVENAVSALGGSSAFRLGSISFSGMEVPASLPIGSTVTTYVERVPGGNKYVSGLGVFEDDLTWQGRFFGASAVSRAKAVAALRDAGKPVTFAGAGIQRKVLIASFSYTYANNGANCVYSIRLLVIPVLASKTGATKSALSSLIGSSAASAVSQVTGAIGRVTSYASTALGTLSTYAGQATQLASLVGAGGLLSKANAYLGQATQITDITGSTLSAANFNTIASSMENTASTLTSATTSLGSELGSIANAAQNGLIGDAGGIVAATTASGAQYSTVLGAAVAKGAAVNIAKAGVSA